MYLFVGLGNPGPQYAKNRHNVGFLCIDEIRSSFGFGPEKNKHRGLVSEGVIEGHKVLTLKPLTYMNRSGGSVAEVVQFYKIPLDHIFVFHDDLDLLPGKIRVKRGGGHGGHNGLRDMDAHVGQDYWRVRIGIGHPGDKNQVSSYVLHDFAKSDQSWLSPLLEAVADEAHLLLGSDPQKYAAKLMMDVGGK